MPIALILVILSESGLVVSIWSSMVVILMVGVEG